MLTLENTKQPKELPPPHTLFLITHGYIVLQERDQKQEVPYNFSMYIKFKSLGNTNL